MLKRSIFAIWALFFVFVGVAPGWTQAVSDDAKAAAKDLMIAMRSDEQFDKMMPIIVEAIKPAIVQGRPEVERDFPQIAKLVLDSFASKRAVFSRRSAWFMRGISHPKNYVSLRRSYADLQDRNSWRRCR